MHLDALVRLGAFVGCGCAFGGVGAFGCIWVHLGAFGCVGACVGACSLGGLDAFVATRGVCSREGSELASCRKFCISEDA